MQARAGFIEHATESSAEQKERAGQLAKKTPEYKAQWHKDGIIQFKNERIAILQRMWGAQVQFIVAFDEVTREHRYWWTENKIYRVVILLLFILVYIVGTWLGIGFALAKRFLVPDKSRVETESIQIIIERTHCSVTLESRNSWSKHGPSYKLK